MKDRCVFLLFFQYFLFVMEELTKMLPQSRCTPLNKINNVQQRDSKKSDISSKSPQFIRRTSVTNMSFTRNYLNQDSKKFIQNIICSTLAGRKETFPKLVLLLLESSPENRTKQQIEATVKILIDHKLFSEFGNNKQVLLSIAQYATMHLYEQNEFIFVENSRNENILKLFEGAVELFKQELNRTDEGLNFRQNTKIVSEKGEFLESHEKFSLIKRNSAKSITKTYILSIPEYIYTKNLFIYQQNKVVKRLLHKTSIFQTFSARQVESLLESCPEEQFLNKQILFRQGNSMASYTENKRQCLIEKGSTNSLISIEHKTMYFIAEGEVQISKNWRNKNYPICILGQGNFVGDEAIFVDQMSKRSYSAMISSLNAKIIPISNKNIQQWIKVKSLGINFQLFVGRNKKSVKEKLEHYENSVYQSQMIKSSVFANAASKSLTNEKREKLKNISNIVGQISDQVEGMQKIKMKRLNFKSVSEEVNLQEPLFTRKDFPAIGSYLKRFENEEKRALEQYKRNRSLHMQ